MDENLARLNRIYPNSKFVSIPAYREETFKDRAYDSAYDTKATTTRWKTSCLNYDQAQEELTKGNRIGWVIPKGFVIIDIDNKDDALAQQYVLKILDKFEVNYSYNYTSKGIHLLFQDPTKILKSDSRMKCGLNIVVDTRANETGYIVLPSNDPHREWGEWNDFVEDIPYFLTPQCKDITPSFIGMQNGDGRNDALFKWRSRLENCHKLTAEQIEKCIRIINENLFETPMTNAELFKTVLRERDTKDKPNFETHENPYNTIAEDIVNKYDIISFYDNYYKFNGIFYEKMEEIELERIIHYDVSKNITQAGRKEIISFLRVKTAVTSDMFDKDWYKIACKNGIINLVTGELEQANKTDINTIRIPYAYNSDPVYSPRIDQFMKELTGGDVIKMNFLYQIAGYCLLKKNIFSKFFLFKGEGGTGKSTYTNLLQKMVGNENCSHVELSEFDKDYYVSTTLSKLINIDDDVSGKPLEETGNFKSIISGEVISARQIYKDVISFAPYITCVFNCNRLPKIMDKSTGLFRRMILIELNNKVAKPDPLFMNKVSEQDMEYFLYKAVDGIKNAIEEGHFRIMQSEQNLLDLFKRRQSPLNEWLYDMDITYENLHNVKCTTLYAQFAAWAQENGYSKYVTAFSFKEDICALYDIEVRRVSTPNKGVAQVFFKPGEFDPNYKPF